MERAEKVPAVTGSLVLKAADLSSPSDYLYGQLMAREKEKECLQRYSSIAINHTHTHKGIKMLYSRAIINETNHLKVAISLE